MKMENQACNKTVLVYKTPEIVIINTQNNIITESESYDPNQGEWDTD